MVKNIRKVAFFRCHGQDEFEIIKRNDNMRKISFLLALVFVFASNMVANASDNVLSASTTTMSAGSQSTIDVMLTNADEVNGLQFDIVLPEGITFAKDEKGNLKISVTERLKGYSVMCREVEKGRYRLMSMSFSASSVQDNEGAVLSIAIDCAPEVKKGAYVILFTDVHLSLAKKSNTASNDILNQFEATVKVE